MKQLSLLLALTFGFLVGHAQDKTTDVNVDEIIATYFENIGGAEKLSSLKNTRMEGKMTQMGMEFNGVVIQAAPNKQRIEVDVQGMQIVQAYDGETAWWINPFMGGTDPQPMPAEMAEEMTKQKFESELLNYKDKGHTLEYISDQEVDGVKCHELKLTKKDGTEEFYYFDPEYMIPIMQKAFVQNGPSKGQAAETYMSDYTEVNGLMFPMHIETRVGGVAQFVLSITKVEMDVELDDHIFALPEATDGKD
ncbi:MAG: hypothetical protein R2795_22870 [Saprospiraceae bacterium]